MNALVAHVLVVDDELPIRKFLKISLTAAGYSVDLAATGAQTLESLETKVPDLVLLDLGLPDEDGKDVIAAIRARTASPIIVLSVRDAEHEKVAALDAGANDFVTKPFGIGELLARIRACLRASWGSPMDESELSVDGLRLDLEEYRVTVDGKEVKLTPHEFTLLSLLMRHAGKVLTHSMILKEIWGPTHVGDTQYLRVYVRQLRRKLNDNPIDPRFISNEPGVGYRLLVTDSDNGKSH